MSVVVNYIIGTVFVEKHTFYCVLLQQLCFSGHYYEFIRHEFVRCTLLLIAKYNKRSSQPESTSCLFKTDAK